MLRGSHRDESKSVGGVIVDKQPTETLSRAIHILTYEKVIRVKLSISNREGLSRIGVGGGVSEGAFNDLFVCHVDLVCLLDGYNIICSERKSIKFSDKNCPVLSGVPYLVDHNDRSHK